MRKSKDQEVLDAIEVKNFSSFADDSSFIQNIQNHVEALSMFRFYPDLFIDLITPKAGSIKLGLDQRVFLRVLVRFSRAYCVFPRGWVFNYALHTFSRRWRGLSIVR